MIGYFYNTLRTEDIFRVSHIAEYLASRGITVMLKRASAENGNLHSTIDLVATGLFENVRAAYYGIIPEQDGEHISRGTPRFDSMPGNRYNVGFIPGIHYHFAFEPRTYEKAPIDEHIEFHAGTATINLRLVDFETLRAEQRISRLPRSKCHSPIAHVLKSAARDGVTGTPALVGIPRSSYHEEPHR